MPPQSASLRASKLKMAEVRAAERARAVGDFAADRAEARERREIAAAAKAAKDEALTAASEVPSLNKPETNDEKVVGASSNSSAS